jgi:hypothetical protein
MVVLAFAAVVMASAAVIISEDEVMISGFGVGFLGLLDGLGLGHGVNNPRLRSGSSGGCIAIGIRVGR